jgi:nucleoside-specific channel-forming protein
MVFVMGAFVVSGRADGTDEGIRSRDNLWLQFNLYNANHLPNAFGDTYSDTYLELEGGGRSGFLDLYTFFDVNEIFGWGDQSQHREAGQFFVKIKPRFSIDAMTGKSLSLGPVKEWYVATQYKGFNDGEYYYAGLGMDLDIPGFEVFGACLWPAFLRESNGANMEYSGFQVSLNWYTTLTRLPWDSTLTYQGYLDYGFGNTYARGEGATRDEFQMFNGFFANHGHYSLSCSVKFHFHTTYHDTENADATAVFFGAHYRM